MLVLGSQLAGLHWGLGEIALAMWAVAAGVALFFGILVLQGAMAFWTVESLEVANIVTYGGVQAAQYPLSLYEKWFRGLLTFVVPLACVAYFPVLVVLGKADPLGTPVWFGVVAPVAGFLFLAVWRWGRVAAAVWGSTVCVEWELESRSPQSPGG